MSSTQLQQTIVVIGATGTQGSGVVRALLSGEYGGGPWFVRALTQDPSSGKAQKLLSEYQTSDNRLSLVTGHVYDKTSLQSAFAGAHGVFAMTSERYPGKVITEEEELKHEIDAGRNIISAAKECCIKHLVFSSLPDIVEASNGQFKRIHHMNNKHTIEQLARKELDGFTSLMPGEYPAEDISTTSKIFVRLLTLFVMKRLFLPQLSLVTVLQASWCVSLSYFSSFRWHIDTGTNGNGPSEDGVVQFCMPLPGKQMVQWTDPSYDMGAFSASKDLPSHSVAVVPLASQG